MGCQFEETLQKALNKLSLEQVKCQSLTLIIHSLIYILYTLDCYSPSSLKFEGQDELVYAQNTLI